jgi:hypothetical protein
MFVCKLILALALVVQDDLFPDDPKTAASPAQVRSAWVVREGLEVLVEPDAASQVTTRLRVRQRLHVRSEGPLGWLAVAPPADSFSWIERAAIEELGDGQRARVVARAAAVRPGSEDASLPAGVWTILHRGDIVWLVDRPPLVMRQPDDKRRVWYAIEPPDDEIRYVAADGVSFRKPTRAPDNQVNLDPDAPASAPSTRLASLRLGTLDARLFSLGPNIDEGQLSAGFRERLKPAEAAHRFQLRLPLESWSFDAVKQSYKDLLTIASSPQEKQVAQARLDQVYHQESLARTARELAVAIERARRIDSEVAAVRSKLVELAENKDAPFEAEGLLQSSSTLVEGRKAFLLIDAKGRTEAYVVVQPGLSLETYLARRVGIYGESRYSPTLKSRIVTARQVVPLDDLR